MNLSTMSAGEVKALRFDPAFHKYMRTIPQSTLEHLRHNGKNKEIRRAATREDNWRGYDMLRNGGYK